ncbi:MAG: hypothetical protein ACE15E_03535 [Acidobacteriota bacterium]
MGIGRSDLRRKIGLVCLVLSVSGAPGLFGQAVEPNFRQACEWWSDLENIWTPLGWKNHCLRVNVLFDGTFLVTIQRHKERLGGDSHGVQITFAPLTDDMRPGKQLSGLSPSRDDNRVVQRWADRETPVLQSEWVAQSLVFRQEVFAHMPGGQDVEAGLEPLFAWVRLSIVDACPGLPAPARAGFGVKVNAPFVLTAMSPGQNIRYEAERSKYPAALAAAGPYDEAGGFRLLEGERVRLGVMPAPTVGVRLEFGKPKENDTALVILMKADLGRHVDLLIPLLPAALVDFEREARLGYEGALAEAERYWSETPPTAARVEVPEDFINQAIRRNLQMTRIIAEKDPGTGQYSLLTGSWTYSQGFWATPGSLALDFLDLMGYHADVERYLEIFRTRQGTVVPPGRSYKLHPGYLSTPKSLTSVDWLTDHGALLWAVSRHALLTGDERFTSRWTPAVLKACEFIRDARRIRGHGGEEGLLPPAAVSDLKTEIQGVWADGWNYKGLVAAVRLLRKTKHPRADEFGREAGQYREAFVQALRRRTLDMPAWTDGSGKLHRQVPSALFGQSAWEMRASGHLDCGPLFLVFAGLMEARDPLMASSLDWFRNGPPTRFYRPDSDWDQLPSLRHEMATSEPCYSWNLFHSWQLGDRPRYLEGLYSLFAGAYSRQTYTVCETRDGITGATHWLPSLRLARLAVIDDELEERTLHLLRFLPLAWLGGRKGARFENMPTGFGPVSVQAGLADQGRELWVKLAARWRARPERTLLHVPPVPGLKRIVLNGRPVKWDGKAGQIPLNGW